MNNKADGIAPPAVSKHISSRAKVHQQMAPASKGGTLHQMAEIQSHQQQGSIRTQHNQQAITAPVMKRRQLDASVALSLPALGAPEKIGILSTHQHLQGEARTQSISTKQSHSSN
ncbi:hypothetical protein Nepgr_013555 [Nepenthes gracilis]|uniref:Uncharacterized protein n=1 Tax=Nepenthes gracilis TaxID=150966 RepID=A0AAD3XP95_NEPGR|nr:hypothetical protein Nepgr_013555 [Nepenthes gracilis]